MPGHYLRGTNGQNLGLPSILSRYHQTLPLDLGVLVSLLEELSGYRLNHHIYLISVPECRSSDGGNSNMPMRSCKVHSLNEKVKIIDFQIRIDIKSFLLCQATHQSRLMRSVTKCLVHLVFPFRGALGAINLIVLLLNNNVGAI